MSVTLESPNEEEIQLSEQQHTRIVAHRLAVLRHAEEVSGNISRTCRYYGISRQCFYKRSRWYNELGPAGLRDRSSRPRRSPRATSAEVVGKIVYLRQHYHFGPLEDRDVPQALPRHLAQPVRGLRIALLFGMGSLLVASIGRPLCSQLALVAGGSVRAAATELAAVLARPTSCDVCAGPLPTSSGPRAPGRAPSSSPAPTSPARLQKPRTESRVTPSSRAIVL